MNEIILFKSFGLVCAGIAIACVILKIFYFIKAGKTDPLKFTASFFKRYNIYQIINAPDLMKHYMKVNNRLNKIAWLCGLVSVATYLFLKKLTER